MACVGVSEGSGVVVDVGVGAVVSVEDTVGMWVGGAAAELQAFTTGMTMMNNEMNLIRGFISIP